MGDSRGRKEEEKREREMSWKGESKVGEEGGQQEERKVVENVMGSTEEKRKGESEMDQGRESKKVVDDVMDWGKVKHWTAPGEREGKERQNRQTVQIFVKVNGLKEFLLNVSMTDNVSDFVRRIPNSPCPCRHHTYVTCEGRVLRLRSSGVSDGRTVQIMHMMRGGGQHRNKKNKAEKKPGRGQQEHDEEKIIQNSEPEQGQQEPKRDKSMLSRENAEDEVIWHFEETEATPKIIAELANGNNSDMQKWIPTFSELTGFNDEQKKTEAGGIRRAVRAKKKHKENQPQHRSQTRECVSKKSQPKRRKKRENGKRIFSRAREARAKESREQEKKRCEEDDDDRVRVVPNMEAGSVRRMRPMERAKEREKEEKENTKAVEDSEVTDNMETKEHHRARGRFRTRRTKSEGRTSVESQSSNGTSDNWR